jgi:hypothetical protein
MEGAVLDHDPASPCFHAEQTPRKDLIAVLDDLLEHDVLLFEDVGHHPGSDRLDATDGPPLGGVVGPLELDVRMHQLHGSVEVTPVEGLVALAQDPDALGLHHPQLEMFKRSGITSVARKIIATPMPTMKRDP